MELIRPTLIVADHVRTAQGIVGNAVLVERGIVQAVGEAEALRSRDHIEERYSQAVIVPGLGDAHFHPTGYTAALTRLNLSGAPDMAELLDRVRLAGRQLPPDRPLIGIRLDNEHLAERRLPTRADLDGAVNDRPVLIFRYCGHIAVANTRALEAAGLTPSRPDPAGGSIDRDESGLPTGVFRETAINLVSDRIGGRNQGLDPEAFLASLRGLVRQGLTRLGGIIKVGNPMWGGLGDDLDLLLEVAPDLPLELAVLVIAESPEALEQAAGRLDGAGRRLRFLGMKDFGDGSLGGHTAAIRAGYADRPETRGTLRFDEDLIGPVARASLDMGGSVAIHAIGDAACGRVIDFFETLRSAGAPSASLRIEHASVLSDQDVEALARVGATASVQPAFLASEFDWLESRLGPARTRNTYAFRSMLDAGIALAGGSDCPVEPPNPLLGMAAARDRCGLVPSEAVSASEALGMFTDGVSVALRSEPPLSVGSPAHLTILDRDPVTADPDSLRNATVLSTWIDGESHPFDPDDLIWD